MTNEEVVIGQDVFEVDRPDLFADGDDHEAESRGQRTAHRAASTLADAFLAKSECLHVQC